MNNRIKQLAEQAGEYVNSVYTPPVRSKTPDKIWEDRHIGWMEQFHAKFAQLIIEECLHAIEDAGGIDKYHYTKAISEHFGGVEHD